METTRGWDYLSAVQDWVMRTPKRIAFENSAGESITYGELGAQSDALANWITQLEYVDRHAPVVLYGHKSPSMLVGMFACAKSGHAYVPVDTIYPVERVRSIVEQLERCAGCIVVINTTKTSLLLSENTASISFAELVDICNGKQTNADTYMRELGDDDTFYILFTSGSTGEPKGVEMPKRYVNYFARWLIDDYRSLASEEERKEGLVWFNRSPFTFDLSTDDLFCGLSNGDKIFALEEQAESSYRETFNAFRESGISDWISTPSFVDACLADPSFSSDLLPALRRVMLAGETLRKDTVARLYERFPGIVVLNNYGPTETGTVTMCKITDEMMRDERSLPIGFVGPEAEAAVLDPQTLAPISDGGWGELFILGNVAKGYWGRQDLTRERFGVCPESLAQGRPSYRTGDACMREANGLLYYGGRFDTMIKLHGYRIEVSEVESVLSAVEEVEMACVLPMRRDNGEVYRLLAVVQPAATCSEVGRSLTRRIKAQVRETLPAYMIPGSFKYLDTLPLNANGKVDRKTLSQLMGA